MSDVLQTPQPAMAEPDPQAGFYLAVSQSPEMLQGRLGLLGSQDREPSVYRQQTVVTRRQRDRWRAKWIKKIKYKVMEGN